MGDPPRDAPNHLAHQTDFDALFRKLCQCHSGLIVCLCVEVVGNHQPSPETTMTAGSTAHDGVLNSVSELNSDRNSIHHPGDASVRGGAVAFIILESLYVLTA